ncbi:hypothetical protein AXG93_4188s1030 [Marchantia polymorpha subsp. ruderalis]|uniref:Non-haem dioxygenase N-terminal domain-containing protein n=1 Tax=Marchantia polymorpha subsp. ruderalis TaxID=1480154 RepID=A0A176WFU0_MARPO|nr:hypothetical protein AXG93_4188s1030 [Marchantia polymorpha subsp. ruderalis]
MFPLEIEGSLSRAVLAKLSLNSMAYNRYDGVLRSRSKSKPGSRRANSKFIVRDDGDECNYAAVIRRMLHELEQVAVIELHCINLDTLFKSRMFSLVREACRDDGVFFVTGHGMPPSLLDDMQRMASIFFSLPRDAREQCLASVVSAHHTRYDEDGNATEESFRIDNEPSELSDIDWPTEPAVFSKVMARYLVEHEHLAGRIMQLVSISLGLSDSAIISACFEPFFSMTIHHHTQYADANTGQGVQNGSKHSGVVTITLPDDKGGLQIWNEGRWKTIRPCKGAVLISVGDQLELVMLQQLQDQQLQSQ